MSEVNIYVATNKQGSDSCAGGTGYSRDEWDALTEEEREEITREIMWNCLEVYEVDE